MVRRVWWINRRALLQTCDYEKFISFWIGTALLIARQGNLFRLPEIVSLSPIVSSSARLLHLMRESGTLGVTANLFDNPIDAFAPPYSLPAIPVFLFIPVDIFIPYWTTCDAIVPGCLGIQKSAEGRYLGSIGELLGWSMTDYSATKNVSAFDFSSQLKVTCRITAVHLQSISAV
jgi:hypothetical protein